MLNIMFNRRNFLTAAGLSSLSYLLPSYSKADPISTDEKSVIFIWLGGGISHIETFDPKPNAPDNIRSVRGIVTNPNGITMGGDFQKLITVADKLNIVRSFKHDDANHSSATHYVMTGHPTQRMENAPQQMPAFGSIVSSYFGAFSKTSLPTYVRGTRIEHDEASFLGAINSPYDSNKDNLPNLIPRVDKDRFTIRYNELLSQMDKKGYLSDKYKDIQNQAYQLLLSNVAEAFMIEKEPQSAKDLYGNTDWGNQLLLSRRLVEKGVKFVTNHLPGWDMHVNINNGFSSLAGKLDQALYALVSDIYSRGMNKNTLIVITGEFGRTYKINATAGRDHQPGLCTLAFAGGDYSQGRIIGESLPNAEGVKNNPLTPQDLTATIFDHFGIPINLTKVDNAGRPRYFIDGEHKNILI